MQYVYVLRSMSNREKVYVGVTNNLRKRLEKHNSGQIAYTAKFVPWKIVYQERIENENAFARERQIKRWSRKKKEALIRGDFYMLKKLSERRK